MLASKVEQVHLIRGQIVVIRNSSSCQCPFTAGIHAQHKSYGELVFPAYFFTYDWRSNNNILEAKSLNPLIDTHSHQLSLLLPPSSVNASFKAQWGRLDRMLRGARKLNRAWNVYNFVLTQLLLVQLYAQIWLYRSSQVVHRIIGQRILLLLIMTEIRKCYSHMQIQRQRSYLRRHLPQVFSI
jgi:hypothetical protein